LPRARLPSATIRHPAAGEPPKKTIPSPKRKTELELKVQKERRIPISKSLPTPQPFFGGAFEVSVLT